MTSSVRLTSILFGDFLRFMRNSKSLSQQAVSHHLGISQNAYFFMENGKTAITLERIELLAKLYEQNPKEFMDRYFLFVAHPAIESKAPQR